MNMVLVGPTFLISHTNISDLSAGDLHDLGAVQRNFCVCCKTPSVRQVSTPIQFVGSCGQNKRAWNYSSCPYVVFASIVFTKV